MQTPSEVKRSIYRLIALIEIFDKEVSSAQKAIIDQPNFPEAKLLSHLEKIFYKFSSKTFDRELSLQNLSSLKTLFKDTEISNFENLINIFVQDNQQKLLTIFDNYSSDDRDSYEIFMVFQPEVILIFERINKDIFRIKDLWSSFLPIDILRFLSNIWGKNFPE